MRNSFVHCYGGVDVIFIQVKLFLTIRVVIRINHVTIYSRVLSTRKLVARFVFFADRKLFTCVLALQTIVAKSENKLVDKYNNRSRGPTRGVFFREPSQRPDSHSPTVGIRSTPAVVSVTWAHSSHSNHESRVTRSVSTTRVFYPIAA